MTQTASEMQRGTLADLPPDIIRVKNGRVVQVERNVLYNGMPTLVEDIERVDSDKFKAYLGGEDFGGTTEGTSIRAVLQRLHEKFQLQHERLFGLVNPVEEDILEVMTGFPKFQIIME